MRILFILLLLSACIPLQAQKMLILERANRAKTTKMYIGSTLTYRYRGPEDYWYEGTITDILPETKTLLLDNFPVKLDSISAIKVRRSAVTRFIGGPLLTLGVSLAFASTVAVLYGNDYNYGKLYGASALSAAAGYGMLTPRVLKLGKKHRLRIIEIKFER
ncbi:MAG: hypothetical protein KGS48_04505 [Bacteroidetes bacterium]|nr:hypothetical protein [Bacteroidota bacterium]